MNGTSGIDCISCLVQRKRHRIALKKRRTVARKDAAADYAKLLAMRTKEAKMKRQEELKRRRSRSQSKSSIGTQWAVDDAIGRRRALYFALRGNTTDGILSSYFFLIAVLLASAY